MSHNLTNYKLIFYSNMSASKSFFDEEDAVVKASTPIKVEKFNAGAAAKFVSIQITLALAAQGDVFYPMAINCLNVYLIKYLLRVGVTFPNGNVFKSFTNLIYPDGARRMLTDMQFSETAKSRFSEDDLRKSASWLNSSVITMVSSRDPEVLMETYELIKSLDGEVVTPPPHDNPKGESFRIKVKVNDPVEIPPNEIYAFKAFAQKTIRDGAGVAADSVGSSPPGTPKKVFNIVGTKRALESIVPDESVDASSSSIGGGASQKKASSKK